MCFTGDLPEIPSTELEAQKVLKSFELGNGLQCNLYIKQSDNSSFPQRVSIDLIYMPVPNELDQSAQSATTIFADYPLVDCRMINGQQVLGMVCPESNNRMSIGYPDGQYDPIKPGKIVQYTQDQGNKLYFLLDEGYLLEFSQLDPAQSADQTVDGCRSKKLEDIFGSVRLVRETEEPSHSFFRLGSRRRVLGAIGLSLVAILGITVDYTNWSGGIDFREKLIELEKIDKQLEKYDIKVDNGISFQNSNTGQFIEARRFDIDDKMDVDRLVKVKRAILDVMRKYPKRLVLKQSSATSSGEGLGVLPTRAFIPLDTIYVGYECDKCTSSDGMLQGTTIDDDIVLFLNPMNQSKLKQYFGDRVMGDDLLRDLSKVLHHEILHEAVAILRKDSKAYDFEMGVWKENFPLTDDHRPSVEEHVADFFADFMDNPKKVLARQGEVGRQKLEIIKIIFALCNIPREYWDAYIERNGNIQFDVWYQEYIKDKQ